MTMSDTRKYYITCYPYAVQYGSIRIPKDVPEEDIQEWIVDHWNEIKFDKPAEIDYEACDFEVFDYFA